MDYNWLLTTIAQSSAALVGISSGFLILRITLFINEKNSRKMLMFESEIHRREAHGDDLEKHSDGWGLVKIHKKREKEYEELGFPHTIWIGLIGIIWLMYFGLYKPVNQLSEFEIVYFNIQCIKNFFFIGLGILAFYLLVEVFNIAFPNFIKLKKDKQK